MYSSSSSVRQPLLSFQIKSSLVIFFLDVTRNSYLAPHSIFCRRRNVLSQTNSEHSIDFDVTYKDLDVKPDENPNMIINHTIKVTL